jgi:hypothetical protein
MNLLMLSGTAIFFNPKLKQDHDTVNGVMNGYLGCRSDQVTAQVGMSIKKLDQCTSEQVQSLVSGSWSLVG